MFALTRQDLCTIMDSVCGDAYHKKCIMGFISDGWFANKGAENGVYKLISLGMMGFSMRTTEFIVKPELDRFVEFPEDKTLLMFHIERQHNVFRLINRQQVFEEWVLQKLDFFLRNGSPIKDKEGFLELLENTVEIIFDYMIKTKTKENVSCLALRVGLSRGNALLFY